MKPCDMSKILTDSVSENIPNNKYSFLKISLEKFKHF